MDARSVNDSTYNSHNDFNGILSADLYSSKESVEVMDIQASDLEAPEVPSANSVVAGPNNYLVTELVVEIFSHLNLVNFRNGSLVCQSWNKKLTSNPELGKHIVYHDDFAMSPEKWEKSFGNEIIPFKEFKEDAYQSLYKDIIKILNMPCLAFAPKVSLSEAITIGSTPEKTPVKRIGNTHVLFYVHKSFTINLLGKLFKQCLGNAEGFDYIDPDIVNQYGDQSIGKSGWWLLTKDVLPGSRSKSAQAHKVMIVDLVEKAGLPYEQPDLVRVLAGMIARYVSTEECLFSDEPWTFTSVIEEVNGIACYAGGFGSSGPGVSSVGYVSGHSGAAALLPGGSAEVF